jgi:hypothetical protein
MASQNYVLRWWNENIPDVRLELTDPIVPSPHVRKRRARGQARPDFTGFDDRGTKVLLIEVKTGRSAIGDMNTFQLDVSDCDDIMDFVRREFVATYVFHVQVIQEFSPPTSYFKPVGLWWTDIFKMKSAFQKVAKRRIDAGKPAAHYDTKCFEDMTSFIREVKGRRYEVLTDRLRKGQIPILY